MDCLIQECHLINGLNVYIGVSKFTLRDCGRNYTLLSNRKGRDVDDIMWNKKGDDQLAVSLIAACQINIVEAKGELKTHLLYGMKVLGEELLL